MDMGSVDFQNRYVRNFKVSHAYEQELERSFFNNKPQGFFVDVGANEPVIQSQTYHFEQLGWRGLLLEPIPHYVQLLKEQRTGKVIQYACSSPQNHGNTLKLIVAGGHSTLNTNPIALGTTSNETIDVTCRTLDSILEENGVEPGFDFISIDIEGHEMEMFKGFTLTKWKPKLVLLEDHVTNHRKHNHMVSNGYQVIMRTGLNSWYVPKSDGYRLSVAARIEFIRKYWLGLGFRKVKYFRMPL
ncbi:FkbM family methyltransferase [Pelodictyon luteolum]|nr:FkbM family methyltransferase [Pelodictyon luteolum]